MLKIDQKWYFEWFLPSKFEFEVSCPTGPHYANLHVALAKSRPHSCQNANFEKQYKKAMYFNFPFIYGEWIPSTESKRKH